MKDNEIRPRTTARRNERRARGEAVDLACARLLSLAQELGPHARMPGLRALGEELQVSPNTLNDALDRLERQRVLVRRERSGVFVAPPQPRRDVYLICSPDLFLQNTISPFWQQVIERSRTLAAHHDTRLTLAFARPHDAQAEPSRELQDASLLPEHLRSEITSGNVHGVVCVNLPHSTARWIEAQGVPVVGFAGAARFIVSTSGLALLEMGAAALAQAGCRKIDVWLPRNGHWHNPAMPVERVLGQALVAHGLRLGRIVPLRSGAWGDGFQAPTIETGWEYALQYFGPDASDRPDGILCVDDMITLGALMAFPHLNIVLGRDVQIATYANLGSPVLKGWQDRLWRIEYDPALLVEQLLDTLDALMEHGPEAAAGEYVPPLPYDLPEYMHPERISERYQLVRPTLVPPAAR